MNFLENLKKKNYQLQLEKLIVGIEEPIFIKGLGNIVAKVDSGNGGFNVIHGEDFYYQGDVVIFTSFDEEGNSHKISKKIQDKVTINIGGGCTEDRPVILLDVKFANDEYLNVPFTVGNRASNKNKVLLGKEFLVKELDALIDVSSANLADKKINIEVPIKEDVGDTFQKYIGRPVEKTARYITGQQATTNVSKSNPSGETSNLGKVGKGVKGAWNAFLAFTSPNSKFFGKGGALDMAYQAYKSAIDEIQKSDKYLIFKAMNEEFQRSGQPIKPFVNNPQVFKLLDYMGFDYENNSKVVDDAKKGAEGETHVQDAAQKGEHEYNIVKSSAESNGENEFKATDKDVVSTKGRAYPISRPNDNNDIIDVDDEEIEEDAENNRQKNQKEWVKAQGDVAKEIAPILYLVIFDGRDVEKTQKILKQNYSQFKGIFEEIYSDIKGNFNIEIGKDLARTLVTKFKENNILTNIALVTGKGGNRKAQFLASNFNPSEQVSFLKQRCEDYETELLKGVKISDDESEQIKGLANKEYLKGTFYNNEIFGFVKAKPRLTGLPDEQFNEWLHDYKKFHGGFNVIAAYNKFRDIRNLGEYSDDEVDPNNINPEKLESAIKENAKNIFTKESDIKINILDLNKEVKNTTSALSDLLARVKNKSYSYKDIAAYWYLSALFGFRKNSIAANIADALYNNTKLINLYVALYSGNLNNPTSQTKNLQLGYNLEINKKQNQLRLGYSEEKPVTGTQEEFRSNFKKAVRKYISQNSNFGIKVIKIFEEKYNINDSTELSEEEVIQLKQIGKELLNRMLEKCNQNIEDIRKNPVETVDNIIKETSLNESKINKKESSQILAETKHLSNFVRSIL